MIQQFCVGWFQSLIKQVTLALRTIADVVICNIKQSLYSYSIEAPAPMTYRRKRLAIAYTALDVNPNAQ